MSTSTSASASGSASALVLPAQLEHNQVASGKWVSQALAADWQIDAGALQQFDSSALALLLDAHRAAGQSGSELTVANSPAKLIQLAKLYGVDELLALQA